MTQHLLLTAFCVLVVVYATSSVEGACRSRCLKHCADPKNRSKLKMSHMDCSKGCFSIAKSCKSCSGPNKCSKCLPGFKQSSSTLKCYPCSNGCRCSPSNKCISCLPGYTSTARGCVACPTGCNCDSNANCTDCKTGYVRAVKLKPTDPDCLACAANCATCPINGPGLCESCNDGFLLVGTACQACGPNCRTCTQAGGCDSCLDGYTFVTSGSKKTCEACPTNCRNCDVAGISSCDVCKSGYGLSTDHKSCVVCAPNCLSCSRNGYGKCDASQCASSLTIAPTTKVCNSGASAATCTITDCEVCSTNPASSCDKCPVGKTLYTGGAACLACTSQDCVYCPAAAATCVICTSAKYGPAGGCTGSAATTACVSGSSDPNCKDCTGSGAPPNNCGECKLGYHLNAGACTQCTVANCDVCETSVSTCDVCKAGYNKIGSVCSDCHARCATPVCTRHGTGKCDTWCIDGYAIVSDTNSADVYKCLPCAPGCKACQLNGPGKCDDQQCASGFKLAADSTCEPVIV